MVEGAPNGAKVQIEMVAQTETPPPGGDAAPTGGFGNPMTFLLLVVAALFLWWTMRRRRTQEERMRALHREQSVAQAEESARNVAHLMRAAPPPGAAAAAAAEGLASAARPLTEPRPRVDGPSAAESAPETTALSNERVEAVALAEQSATEQAHRAAGEAEARRMQAAREGATEARADIAEVVLAGVAPGQEALRSALGELDSEVEPPFGATAGDGSANCPPEFPIKGNTSSKIYHEPGQSSYAPTVAEFCFASAEAAEAAGFRQSRARGQRAQE